MVWIEAYARSASSTLLSLVESVSTGQVPSPTMFAIFEPSSSHGDEEWTGGSGTLQKLVECNFSEVDAIREWNNVHTKTNGAKSVSEASAACASADIVVYKTVNYGHNVGDQVLPFLVRNEGLHVLSLVRDPRGIYGSQENTAGNFTQGNNGIAGMLSVCDTLAANLQVRHPMLKVVEFDELVLRPLETTKSIFKFLNLTFGDSQIEWVHENFNAKVCLSFWGKIAKFFTSLVGISIESYNDCHEDSTTTRLKWKSELSDAELQAFENHTTCLTTARAYGWPTGVIHRESATNVSGLVLKSIVCVVVLGLLAGLIVCGCCKKRLRWLLPS